MTMEFNTLNDIDVYEKTVLLRVDFNMPLDKDTKKILDTTRIKRVLPTFLDLIEKKAKIVVIAHQGRKGSWDSPGGVCKCRLGASWSRSVARIRRLRC